MIILCHWAPAWPPPSLVEVLPCESCKPQYGTLLSHKRIYEIKEEKENGEALRSTSKWDIVGVDAYIVECLLFLVMWILIVVHIYNMLLVTGVYCLFSLLMVRLWWPYYDALVYDLTLSNGDIIYRHYMWWNFYALHTGGMSENLKACNIIFLFLTLHVVSLHLNYLCFWLEAHVLLFV